MTTTRTTVSAALFLAFSLLSQPLWSEDLDQSAEEFIRSVGGSAYRDPKQKGNPIVHVRLRGLRDRKITDADLQGLTGLKHLTALDLFSTRVTDAGMGVVKNFKDLERLNLTHTDVTDGCLKHLKELPKLRELRMEGTGISNAGLVQLKEFKELRLLETLDTAVSRKAWEEFKRDRPNISVPRSSF